MKLCYLRVFCVNKDGFYVGNNYTFLLFFNWTISNSLVMAVFTGAYIFWHGICSCTLAVKVYLFERLCRLHDKSLQSTGLYFQNYIAARHRAIFNFYNLGRFQMEQNPNKIQGHEDTKKLSFVVVFLSIFVIALFSLAPLV